MVVTPQLPKSILLAFGLVLTLLEPQFAHAGDIELYEGNSPQGEYDERVDGLKPGDLVHFARSSVRIGKALHHPDHIGATSIYAINHNWAIRIPRYAPRPGSDSASLMNSFLSEYFELKKSGAPVVNIDLEYSQSPQYLLVERKNILFTLEKWILERLNKKSTEDEEHALMEFAERTGVWEKIGDFGLRQVGFDGTEWVLMDWDKGSRLATQVQDETIWEGVTTFKKLALHLDLHQKLILAARRARLAKGLPSCADHLRPADLFRTPKIKHPGVMSIDPSSPIRFKIPKRYRVD